MGKKINNEEERQLIIDNYLEFANKLGRTPTQKDLKNERKYNNPNWIVTLHKINLYFNGTFELNEICGLKNYFNSKRENNTKRTHADFLEEVNKIAKDKYEFLTEYINSWSDITVRCKLDGYTWTVNANGFLKHGCKCPKCSNCVQNKDTEYFKQEVREVWGDEYAVLGEYNGARESVLIKHIDCGNEFLVTPDSLLHRHTGCPICSHRKGANKLFITHENFLDIVKDKYGDSFSEYEILSQYKGGKEYVLVKHNKCGHIYEQRADDMKQGKKCKYCCGTMKKSQEKFEFEIEALFDGEYSVVGDYINAKTNVKVRHNKCGKVYNVLPGSILKGCRCSCETISYGEYTIKNFLEFNKIKYKSQYRIKDCKDKRPLPFDFAVFDDKHDLIKLIEYDGEQHYKDVFGNNGTKIRDKIKNQFCKENQIPLLRIPYWEFNNINIILRNELSKVFKRELIIPDKDVLQWEVGNNIRLLETFKTLPNGIYTKRFILDMAKIEGNIFSRLIENDLISKIIKDLNIEYNEKIVIISDNYSDYDKYFQLISENMKEYKIIEIMKNIYSLHLKGLSGKYAKKEFSDKLFVNSSRHLRKNSIEKKFFYNDFLNDLSIILQHNYIIFNKKEVI